MKIGIVSFFGWRPHIEQMFYLSQLLEKDNHEIFFLTCDSGVPICYSRLFKGHNRINECIRCTLGGFRSFTKKNISNISSKYRANLDQEKIDKIISSSLLTLFRSENKLIGKKKIEQNLGKSVNIIYGNVINWVVSNKLGGIILFNGRMDLTAAALHACLDNNIPIITCERTRQNGLLLKPNADCLSQISVKDIVLKYQGHPLKKHQAIKASQIFLTRLKNFESKEWRNYSDNFLPTTWPISDKTGDKKVLILPSSRSEVVGHPDWDSKWHDYTIPFKKLIDKLHIQYDKCILRCHPGWSRKIGTIKNDLIEEHYIEWANKLGIYIIPSHSNVSTYDLIKEADIIVVNGSSTAFEAAIQGKLVISIGKSSYSSYNFLINIKSDNDWHNLRLIHEHNPRETIRNVLRVIYSGNYRHTQYNDFIESIGPLKFKYYEGADPNRIINIFKTGKLMADDNSFAEDTRAEDKIIDQISNGKYDEIINYTVPKIERNEINLQRRFGFRWVDIVRPYIKRGDE